MFTLDVSQTYTAPVKGVLPGDVPFDFEATFNRLSTADLKDLDRVIAEGATDDDIAARVLAGWRGVIDRAGAEMPFTPTNLAAVLAVHGVARAVVRSFYESLAEGRRKN